METLLESSNIAWHFNMLISNLLSTVNFSLRLPSSNRRNVFVATYHIRRVYNFYQKYRKRYFDSKALLNFDWDYVLCKTAAALFLQVFSRIFESEFWYPISDHFISFLYDIIYLNVIFNDLRQGRSVNMNTISETGRLIWRIKLWKLEHFQKVIPEGQHFQ